LQATEADHAKEVLDVVLPADHEPTKMMEAREKSFDSPASAAAPPRTTILRWCLALSTMRGDHLNAMALGQILIRRSLS